MDLGLLAKLGKCCGSYASSGCCCTLPSSGPVVVLDGSAIAAQSRAVERCCWDWSSWWVSRFLQSKGAQASFYIVSSTRVCIDLCVTARVHGSVYFLIALDRLLSDDSDDSIETGSIFVTAYDGAFTKLQWWSSSGGSCSSTGSCHLLR